MSSSIASIQSKGSYSEHVSFVMPSPNGIQAVYFDDAVAEVNDATLNKTLTAFILRLASAETPQIEKKIQTGRVAVIRFQDRIPQSIIICPHLKLANEINRFVLCMQNDKGVEGSILISEKVQLKKLSEENYVKLSKKLGAEVKFVSDKV